jgi:ABC-type proline/glycine betaine transport system substrate-binding protein
MNTRFKMKYLTGGDDSFGPNFGQAIYTNTQGLRPGMQQRGPVAEKPVVHPEHGKHADG